MGKRGGCVPSKKKGPSAATDVAQRAPIVLEEETYSNRAGVAVDGGVSGPIAKLKVFYSMYRHVEGLARRMKKGIDNIDGVEGFLYRVPETLSADVLNQMKASLKDDDISEITAAELAAADGVLFGFPMSYGFMVGQMKAFFDSTSQLWLVLFDFYEFDIVHYNLK